MEPVVVAKFSETPSGRFYSDGPYSGEAFREETLRAAIERLNLGDKLRIIIDNVEGYGSSFLEEAFGGLVRHGIIDRGRLLEVISIEYTDEYFSFYEKRIIKYINDAEKEE